MFSRLHAEFVPVILWFVLLLSVVFPQAQHSKIGREVSVQKRLDDGDEYKLPPIELVNFGRTLFNAI